MKYMLLIFDDETLPEKVQQQEFPLWLEYTRVLREAGVMLHGEALQPSLTASTVKGTGGSGFELTDGPFVELKEVLSGYYLIDVNDLDQASTWASKMPHIARGGSVEIRPIVDIPH